jgi:hemoglobin
MNAGSISWVAGVAALAIGLGGCSGMGSTGSSSTMAAANSLYQQLGGMDTMTKLGSDFVASSMKDPRLSSLLGKVNPTVASPKVADQLCAALGGGCKAPYTDEQIATAANRLTPEQKTAVSDNFGSTLNAITSNPALRDAVTKSLSSKLSGIVGGIL